MPSFTLNSTLENDTIALDENGFFTLRLHKNPAVIWLILVPKTDKTEIYQLSHDLQQKLQAEINHLSAQLKNKQYVEKLNIASIGNIVSQLHVHIIGRFETDPYWPNPVWGQPQIGQYSEAQINHLKADLQLTK